MTAVTLVDFLLARIAEDEAVARAAAEAWPPKLDDSDVGAGERFDRWYWAESAFVARMTPARVLAECDAKRRIVGLADWSGQKSNLRDRVFGPAADVAFRHGIAAAMQALALPHADHPDYRTEWAPDTT